MVKYILYKGRPCGSTARGSTAWKKSELIQEAENLGLSTSGTINDLCNRLIAAYTVIVPMSNPSVSASVQDTQRQCQSKPPDTDYKYCTIHQSCHLDKIQFTTQAQPQAQPHDRDLSHMTMRVSFNKLQFDIVKSGLQKSIRRCMLPQALSYGIEGDLFSLAESLGHARGNRTNMMNRLRIILVEDLFDWRTILQVEPWFTAWEKERKNISSRKYLLSIIRVLTTAKKIRLVNDLKVFLIRDLYRQVLGNKYDKIFSGWNEHGGQTDNMSRFIYLLRNKNPNCLHWYEQVYLQGHYNSVWGPMIDLVSGTNPTLLSVIKSLYRLQSQLTKDHRERYIYILYAIALILFEHRIDWSIQDLPVLMTDQEAEQMYQDHLQQWRPDNLPYDKSGWLPENIVVDKHTMRGRARGKTTLDFAVEGSLVFNEDKNFYFPILRNIFIEKKTTESQPGYKPIHVPPLDETQKTVWNPEYLIEIK